MEKIIQLSFIILMRGFNQGTLPGEEYEEYGRMEDPDTSSKVIESGENDGIAIGRQFLADSAYDIVLKGKKALIIEMKDV